MATMKTIFRTEAGTVREGWKALGFLALTAVILKLGNLAAQPALPFLKAHRAWIPQPLVAGLLVLIPTWICLRMEGGSLRGVGLGLDGRWLREALVGTAWGIALIGVVALLVRGLGGFHFERGAATGAAVGVAFWMFVGVAFFEELAFRGYLFQRLVGGAGPWVAQLVLAVFFALGHWGNPGMQGATKLWASLNIGLAAIMLGLAYLKTRSLALPMGMHLGWNWAQGTLLGFGVSGNEEVGLLRPVFHGRPEWLTGGAFGLEASLPALLVLIAFILYLSRWKTPEAEAPASAA